MCHIPTARVKAKRKKTTSTQKETVSLNEGAANLDARQKTTTHHASTTSARTTEMMMMMVDVATAIAAKQTCSWQPLSYAWARVPSASARPIGSMSTVTAETSGIVVRYQREAPSYPRTIADHTPLGRSASPLLSRRWKN